MSVILGLIILGAIGGALGDSSNNKTNSDSKTTKSESKQYRFTDRADKQPTDVEVEVGEAATVKGLKMTVTKSERLNAISDFEKADDGKQYLRLTVNLENTDSKTHPYSYSDFKVQTASGQVIDATFNSSSNALDSADLVTGGKASGVVVIEVPVEQGQQYAIWKPGFESDRAIIKVP